jgi:5-methylcytosine-specific restriction protein B
MPEVLRSALLLRTCMEILRDADGTLPRDELITRIGDRVTFTPYKEELDANGRPRWRIHLGWYTGDAATVGWMTKRDGQWSITEAGEAALDSHDEEGLLAELRHRHGEIRQARAQAVHELSDVQEVIARALGEVAPGSWASYDDLATLVDASPGQVPHFLAGSKKSVPGSHRVLRADGQLPDDGMLHFDLRGMDLAKKLRSEGIEFDEEGHALQSQRMSAAEIEERLVERDRTTEPEAHVRRAWLVRGSSVNGVNLVPVWLRMGSTSLAATQLRPVAAGIARDELQAIVNTDYEHASYNARREKLDEFHVFLARMQVGDLVLTTSGGNIFVGEVVGDATYVESKDGRSNLRREARWLNPDEPVDFADLPDPLPARLSSQHDVVDLTSELPLIEALVGPPQPPAEESLVGPVTLPDATEDLANRLLVDLPWLRQCVDLLRDRSQVILYGPPGTGKTYIAQHLARFLAGRENVKLVQFHPAYSYEDFFEGFRPHSTGDGGLGFDLRPGPFRKLVDRARDDPATPYILIIDEINRANLAKVFGELYFLLEYRDHAIDLLYAADELGFTLPKNVFIIGTMNTADRSIALVDAAMRRRFAFVELHPSEEPTAGMLDRWLAREKLPDTAGRLLRVLNDRIDDPDFKIGPSYLMRPSAHEDGGLERLWRTSIMPLLQEHHYGEEIDLEARYGLDRLRGIVDAERSTSEDEPGSETP